MNKRERKQDKRRRLDIVRKSQDAWVEHFGLNAPTTRRERDRRFTAAQKLSLIMQGITGAAS